MTPMTLKWMRTPMSITRIMWRATQMMMSRLPKTSREILSSTSRTRYSLNRSQWRSWHTILHTEMFDVNFKSVAMSGALWKEAEMVLVENQKGNVPTNPTVLARERANSTRVPRLWSHMKMIWFREPGVSTAMSWATFPRTVLWNKITDKRVVHHLWARVSSFWWLQLDHKFSCLPPSQPGWMMSQCLTDWWFSMLSNAILSKPWLTPRQKRRWLDVEQWNAWRMSWLRKDFECFGNNMDLFLELAELEVRQRLKGQLTFRLEWPKPMGHFILLFYKMELTTKHHLCYPSVGWKV